jgi:hypothetical protein
VDGSLGLDASVVTATEVVRDVLRRFDGEEDIALMRKLTKSERNTCQES